MDIRNGKISQLYRSFLLTAFGSTIISSVYSTVDLIAVGHSCGPSGSAALSCINPIWAIMISLGQLFGVGGAVLMSNCRGSGKTEEANCFFTLSSAASLVASGILVLLLYFRLDPLLRLLGAEKEILPYCRSYARWIVLASPCFLLGTCLSAFIRNDGAPVMCAVSLICGGIVNILGDYLLVFVVRLGMGGAGLATALGQAVGFLVLCTYFFQKRCRLRWIRIRRAAATLRQICFSGFSAFLLDLSFGLTVLLFNNQIMRYASSVELAIFGAVCNTAILFQSLFCSVGQALQPIVSVNYGAGLHSRVRKTIRISLLTAAAMGLAFFLTVTLLPTQILRLYMKTTPQILSAGPPIFRTYAAAFLPMGINVVAAYSLQSILHTRASACISLARGLLWPLILLLVLPAAGGLGAIWWAMPMTELLTLLGAVPLLRKAFQPDAKASS